MDISDHFGSKGITGRKKVLFDDIFFSSIVVDKGELLRSITKGRREEWRWRRRGHH